jgi:NAD dependent epimerase/dehydratase family enzyme
MKKKCISNRRYGFVGKELTKALINVGYTVSILSRTKIKIRQAFLLHVGYRKQTIEKEAVLNADYIIHLADNIAEKPWTKKRKEQIITSREQSTQLIYSVLKKSNKKLDALFLHRQLVFMEQLMGKKFVLKLTF